MKANQKTFFIVALAILFPVMMVSTVEAQALLPDICDLIKAIAALITKVLALLAELIKCIKAIIDAGIKCILDLITKLNAKADSLRDQCRKRGVDITACIEAERACVAKINVTTIQDCSPTQALECVQIEIKKLKALSDQLAVYCKGPKKCDKCKKLEAEAKKQETVVLNAIKTAQGTKQSTQDCVNKQVAILTAQIKKCETDFDCCVRECCGL